MPVTKTFKTPSGDYQVWETADLSVGDILDITTSLGGKPAKFITIDSDGGQTIVRFNVCHKIFKNQKAVGNEAWLGPDAAFYDSAQLVDEIEKTRPNVIIEADATESWRDELAVADIKIIQLAPVVRITVS